jgi:succinyl-CoA synthetase beta subunit
MLVNRETGKVSFVASTEGGMDIEAVAEARRRKIHTIDVDPMPVSTPQRSPSSTPLSSFPARPLRTAESCSRSLYKAFTEKDMSLLEINPLIVMKDGHLRVLDAKVSFDGNALFRHPDVMELRDKTEEDEKEIEASKYDLAYVALDGDIGCMVNGAGLAMATMDIIKLYGKEPANFLDVGGGATKRKGDRSLQDHHRRPQCEGHSGQHLRRHHALRCDRRRRDRGGERGRPAGAACRAPGRHQGRRGQGSSTSSGLNVIAADDLDDAAQKIVKAG